MSRRFVVLLAVLLIALLSSSADSRRPRKKTAPKHKVTAVHKERLSKQSELARLRKEIAATERELNAHIKKEKLTKKQLAVGDARTRSLRAKIVTLRAEADELSAEKQDLDVSIKQTASTIDTLKRSYATDAIRRYTSGVFRESVTTGSGFDDPSTETARLRNAYYASIASKALHHNKQTLDSTQTSLSTNRDEVASLLNDQLGAISQTKQEQQSAEVTQQQKTRELQTIEAKKQALQKELDRRKQSAKKLEAIIANLAAKEEADVKRRKEILKKREAERRSKRKAGKKLTTNEQQQEKLDAQEQKNLAGPHSLSWPVSSHHIVQAFGEQRNKELGTVTMNLGIDIGTSSGSSVRASANGKVALVSSLPSYGTLVIVRHGGGVLTVYADLSSVSVSSGEAVSKGDVLGRSGSNSELGDILHFEVWKGKSKQNPMRWLK